MLTPEKLKKLTFGNIQGSIGVICQYQGSYHPPEKSSTDDVVIKREYKVSGQPTRHFKPQDLIEVSISWKIGGKAPDGIYRISDYLPAGLKLIEKPYNRDVVKDNLGWPVEVNGQKIVFLASDKGSLRYYARVVNGGIFTAQGMMIQHTKNGKVYSVTIYTDYEQKQDVLIATVLIWGIISFTAVTSGRTGTSMRPGSYPPVHPNTFFDPAHFYTGKITTDSPSSRIKGAVIPHHLLADKLIARVISALKEQKPATIILIGPNHKNNGSPMLTSSLGWQTPFGVVEGDGKMVQNLCQASSLIHENDQIIGAEHSMGNIMPFIKYYLPETKVVPLILHNDITLDEASKLGKQLGNLMKPDTVILASVDFSHYLTGEEAAKKDEETLLALKNKNLGRIFSMNDDYLDSPPSIGVLFQAMNQRGIDNFEVLDHTNSGILLDNKKIQTTSYITLIFDIKD